MTDQPAAHRRAGRKRRDTAAASPLSQQLPFNQARLPFPPMRLISDDEIEQIHRSSLRLLEEIGMDVLNPEARSLYGAAGALIQGERVRIGRDIVEAALATAPREFTMYCRNAERNIRMGGNWIAFWPVGGPPHCSDMDRGRRPGTLEDSQNFIRLAQFFNCVSGSGGGSVDALDYHARIRHLHVYRGMFGLSDKFPFVTSTGRERLFDGIEMTRIARGLTPERFDREPSCMTVINTNSPLKLDLAMAMGIMEMARHNQVCCVTPFTLAGAMAPITISGAVVLQNAEALAGLSLHQLARPGAPFIYGGFTSNVDMKSGAPAFGTPEYMQACILGGQMARRYSLPYRTSSTNAANIVDAQAAYESVFSLWGAIMGGGNLILHSFGWMEGGLVASYEKFMLDVDLVQMVMEFLRPLDMSEEALGLEAIREVGPGGHFFGAQHTLSRYSTAFYAPLISDWRNFQQWSAAGKPVAWQRANALWKQVLQEYREPALDPAIAEELDAYVARRIEEGGQPTDF
jgi:trimethylamine--corrinoid protein Co-methyltransferase